MRRRSRMGRKRKRRRKKEGEEVEGEERTGGRRRKRKKWKIIVIISIIISYYWEFHGCPPAMFSDSSFLLNHYHSSLFSLFPHLFHFLQPNKNFLPLLCRTNQLFFEAIFLKSPYKSRCVLYFHSTLT